MLNIITAPVRSMVAFFRPKSVSAVMAGFTKQIAQLEKLSEQQLDQGNAYRVRAEKQKEAVRRTREKARLAEDEALKADATAARLRLLTEG